LKTFSLYVRGRKEPFEEKGDRISANNQWAERLWILGNEYGVMGVVWGQHEQDALDELVDQDLAGGILVDAEYAAEQEAEGDDNELSYLGNSGEPADCQHLWMYEVVLKPGRDDELIDAFRFAEEEGHNLLDAETLCTIHEGDCQTNYELGRACWRERREESCSHEEDNQGLCHLCGKTLTPGGEHSEIAGRRNPTAESTGVSVAAGVVVGSLLGFGVAHLVRKV